MKNNIFFITIITIIIFIFVISSWRAAKENNLTTPLANSTPSVSSTPTPIPTPKTFKYEASTDLEKELESINPKVLDSDFDE